MINCDYCYKMFYIKDLFKCSDAVDRCYKCEEIRQKRKIEKKNNRKNFSKAQRIEYMRHTSPATIKRNQERWNYII